MLDMLETSPNERGVCAVCPSKTNFVLAYPDKTEGEVRVINFDNMDKTIQIAAHQTKISALSINHDGNLLATGSDKGTLVRLWDTETGMQLQELRRGSD